MVRPRSDVVKLEHAGGASGIVAVAAITTQFVLAGAAATDASSMLAARARWEWVTLLRAVGGLGILWFTSGFAARLRHFGNVAAGPAALVVGSGLLWGAAWLLSAVFNSTAIGLAVRGDDIAGVPWLSTLGANTVLVLTPALMITFLFATGVAVLSSPTFPRRFAHAAFFFGAIRAALALTDWYGSANLTMRIMDMTLIWVVIASIHLMGATRPQACPGRASRGRRWAPPPALRR